MFAQGAALRRHLIRVVRIESDRISGPYPQLVREKLFNDTLLTILREPPLRDP